MTSISIPIENKRKSKIKIFVCSIRQNGVSIIICMFCIGLILYSNSSLKAAKDGLVLWATAVVPSLFPFFISIELLSHTNIVKTLGKYLNPIMRPLFNVPGEGAFAFLMGLISGYPVGAKVVVKLFEQNIVTKDEAERLLAFTNNSGPLFIIGTVGIALFGSTNIGILLFITHIFACVTGGIFLRFSSRHVNFTLTNGSDSNSSNSTISLCNLGELLGKSITNSISSILTIGGFVVVFSVVISILNQSGVLSIITTLLSPILCYLGFPSELLSSLLIGVIEVTNGVNASSNIHSLSISIITTSFLLGFGGFSVLLQVLSIISKARLSIKSYIIGKLLQGIFAAFYTYLFISFGLFI